MNELNTIIEKTFKKYIGVSIKELNETLAHSIDNRMIESVSGKIPFKLAKNSFLKQYFTELLTFCHGNISKAAIIAQINRRHIHRLCNELSLDITNFRENMIKPYLYLKENVATVIEKEVENFSESIHPNKIKTIYSNINKISKKITDVVEHRIASFDDAIHAFESNYFTSVMRLSGFDTSVAANMAEISERSIHRKIKELQIS